jgi:membrane-associated phospholipid phosphatase
LPIKHIADARTPVRQLTRIVSLGIVIAALAPSLAAATVADADNAGDGNSPSRSKRVFEDIGAYAVAPLHWDRGDWLYFGGAIAAIGAAHHFDEQVRTHFTAGSTTALNGKASHDAGDAIPAAAVVAGTWLYATLIDDDAGRSETWSMLEAAGLSSATGLILKYAAGRERPNETTDPNRWREGSDSFPSIHVTAAFAIGTVLAESGNDRYRWLRRVLGYGMATATGYERLKHNSHWLSDTVGGAALGMATAHFVMNRENRTDERAAVMVVPLDGGAMLTYSAAFR